MAVRKLIINADDLGLSPGVNAGILEAHTRGVVTSASLMVLERAAQEAADATSGYAALSLGLHFVDDGSGDLDDPAQAERSFREQLERFRQLTSRDPTHVDSHHHVHTASPARLATFVGLVEPLGVPLRGHGRVGWVGAFWAQWEIGVTNLRYVSSRFLLHLVRSQVRDGVTEIGCHPARVIGDFRSSYLQERAVELTTLTEPGLREAIERLGVELVSFHACLACPP